MKTQFPSRKKFILILSALFFWISAIPLWGISQEQATLDEIQKKYDSVQTFEARFVQKSYVKTMNQTLEARGEVQIKKPGQMKWVYKAPDPQVLVTNKKVLWLYVLEDNQVTKMAVENIYSSNTPAMFLAGKGKLTESFHVAGIDREKDQTTVTLIPKEEDNSLDRLVLFAENKTYQITGSTVYDKLGNKTEIQFSDILVNRSISDNTFQFKIPAGVELLDYTEKP